MNEEKGKSQYRRGLDDEFVAGLGVLARQHTWFADVLQDEDLILGIRDNYLNVYWCGQSLFKIEWRGKRILVSTHPKYLVDPDLADPVAFTEGTFQVQSLRPLLERYDEHTLSRMKRAAKLYRGREKQGLHAIIRANPNVIDTEIALAEGSGRTVMRLDVAAIVDGPEGLKVRFWEAKHFLNPELRSRGRASVVDQIGRYRELISAGREEILRSCRRIAENLVELSGFNQNRRVSEEVRQVAAGKTLALEEPPFVGLLVYGFDRAQKQHADWLKHLGALEQEAGLSIQCKGSAAHIRLDAHSCSSAALHSAGPANSRSLLEEHQPSILAQEKRRLAEFRTTSPFFSETARGRDGLYRGRERPFCLPVECAAENLYQGIRAAALEYFHSEGILWHDGVNRNPSNHLCDSQVFCVNTLFPFAKEPDGLSDLLRPHFPDLRRAVPVRQGRYVEFEWIGDANYLNERVPRGEKRTRGANCTSADAIVAFERADAKRQVVLIEWKYTESYAGQSIRFAKSGTDRAAIYRNLFDAADCPIDKQLLASLDGDGSHYEDLFFEPFYQFMRQQFLAWKMESARELDADVVSVLHIAPSVNAGFRRITSPRLRVLGPTAVSVWSKLVRDNRFKSICTEDLFGTIAGGRFAKLQPWKEYMLARYPWLAGQTKTAGA